MKAVVVSAAAALAALALAAPAGAVNLPKSQAQVSSAQIVDGTLVWFQRNDRIRHKKHGGRLITKGVGAIYARPLGSKQVTRVYMPPAGNRIVDFKTGAGRVVIGLATIAKGDRGPSSIVELTAGTPVWTAATIASESDADAAGCGARVRLVGVRGDGEVLAERTRLTGRDGQCLPVRQESDLVTLSKSGAENVLGKRTSGWASAIKWNLLPALLPTNNTLLLQQLVANGRVYPGTIWNPDPDEFIVGPAAAPGGRIMQVFDGGKVLVRSNQYEAGVIDATKTPASYTSLLPDDEFNYISWYRACGSHLLEIRTPWYDNPDRVKWSLKLRSSEGEVTRTLKDKLPQGTAFDACDENTAVFHRPRHDGGIRQWAVDLSP